jgi:hypothetical protein
MKLEFTFNAFYYAYRDGIIKEAERIGDELYIYISNNSYVSDIALDKIALWFINTENLKCRVRPFYMATLDHTEQMNYNVMTLFYEIPLPQSEFVTIPEDELPTYIGKALLNVLESQNAPVKIRKQFDRERFISDVRDFFVNVKGCQL